MKIQTTSELNSEKRNINYFQGKARSVLEIIKSNHYLVESWNPWSTVLSPPVSDAIEQVGYDSFNKCKLL